MYVQDVVATAEAMHAFGGLIQVLYVKGGKKQRVLALVCSLLCLEFSVSCFCFLLLFIVKISHELLK
ncbi:hypothetical protein GLYMA_02G025800v4 [Glycine max]|uniref:Uncharacterized protein n=2 Tax=Glycine subgen. Soja TaxID=1462606 RepID=K7K629_SOYBN|nr:hypothetical protein JHK85_003163 [Glycine max]KAH1058418.1 hypothetical protein GYH30_002814 [Glycine max]KHN28694.1 hypothetical protein glysoja_025428 [Glycine soja]KRH69420.1 hypothetical protein GLYMA_02G025800v4 [Glycine max]